MIDCVYQTELTPLKMLAIPCVKLRLRMSYRSLVMMLAVVKMPPPPHPATNLAAMSHFIDGAIPQPSVPKNSIATASWFAPRRPSTFERRP